jgi:hypothetical protein
MDKVLIQVFVPVLERSFDMFVPLRLPMYEVVELVKRAVEELSEGSFRADESTVLCRREDGTILNINQSVHELKIQNGSKLMLI